MTDWQLVHSAEEVDAVLASAQAAGVVAIDTEFMRRNTFYPQAALVQLCFDGTAYLLDPLTLADTQPLVALLEDASVLKVMHSASEDLEVFQRWLGAMPAPLFDTQRAAGLLGLGFGMGYRKLVLEICGVDLPKGETRSDWLQRPLTQSQCEYAGMDVTYLLQVWRELDAQASARGRVPWVLADGADAVANAGTDAPEYYRKIKSAFKLSRRQLAALIGLCEWREHRARDRDKPRSWILDDKLCLELARQMPATSEQLRGLDLPPAVLRRSGERLLEIVAKARELPDASLPQPLPAPLPASERDRLARLKQRTREIAAELQAAPEVLMSGKDFEMLVREHRGEPVVSPRAWQGWRKDCVLTPLRQEL
jgi:ribonuclease D